MWWRDCLRRPAYVRASMGMPRRRMLKRIPRDAAIPRAASPSGHSFTQLSPECITVHEIKKYLGCHEFRLVTYRLEHLTQDENSALSRSTSEQWPKPTFLRQPSAPCLREEMATPSLLVRQTSYALPLSRETAEALPPFAASAFHCRATRRFCSMESKPGPRPPNGPQNGPISSSKMDAR